MKELNIKEILKTIRTLLKKVISHSLLVVFIMIAIAFFINNHLFNRFYFYPVNEKDISASNIVYFNDNIHNEVIDRWERNEETFIEADYKNYFDPFYPNFSMRETSEKRLSEERTEELLSNPTIQALLETSNLYEFYNSKGVSLLAIGERAEIWEELLLGNKEEYSGTYSQNILLLEELKKELTD